MQNSFSPEQINALRKMVDAAEWWFDANDDEKEDNERYGRYEDADEYLREAYYDYKQLKPLDEWVDPLTVEEHLVLTKLGDCWKWICKIVGDDQTRASDLNEAIFHIHALQRMIMANAAARLYPGRYRALGETVAKDIGNRGRVD